jgi:uncharacterized membrane protein
MIASLRHLVLLFATLVLALMVHLASIMLLPHLAPTDTWTRLGRFESGPGFQVLPAVTPDASPLRLSDPATVIAVCRYDLEEDGAILVGGRANVAYWSISLHTRQGAAYYAINDRGLGERPLELRVMPADEVADYRAELPAQAEETLIVPAPQPRGFVVFRALVPYPSARARVEAETRNLSCRVAEE